MMEMTLRPMTGTEHFYCYSQSQQLSMQTGLIGHLRADFGSTGKQFFSTFFDFRDSLKSEDFRMEFDDVINALRDDSQYGGILTDRKAMAAFCRKHPESCVEYDRQYGFRADTEHYSYMIRVNPHKGEYNLYCYCYVRQWLDRHMKQAEKGIRFITPNYEEKFRIADGDKVRIITKGGERRDMTCRYIDDYHLETGSYRGENLYHICEFAERMEQAECQSIIPLRASLPEKCFSYLETTGEMIIIEKGEKGYTPTNAYAEGVTPREGADAANKLLGVTRAQEEAMVAGSMFGWHVPGADPKNYDENGQPLSPKQKDRGDAR